MAPQRTEKPIRTEQEMFPLIESWLKSKLTQKEFSQKHKLPLHILPYWVGRYRKAHSLADETIAATASFIQLTPASAEPTPSLGLDPGPATLPVAKQVDPSPAPIIPERSNSTESVSPALEMEVAFPSGMKIHFSSLVPVTYLKELVSVCFR